MPPATSTTSHPYYYYDTYTLTTTFTPPSSCLAPTYTLSPDGYDFSADAWSQTEGYTSGLLFRGIDPDCYPSDNYWTCNSTCASSYLGKICPVGYATVGTTVGSYYTEAVCCPSHFHGADYSNQICTSGVDSDAPSTVIIVDGTQTSAVKTYSYDQLARAIVIAWDDYMVTTTAAAPLSTLAPITSYIVATVSPAGNYAESFPSPDKPTRHFYGIDADPGSLAGIIVGLSFAAIAILAMLGMMLWQAGTYHSARSAAKSKYKRVNTGVLGDGATKAELDSRGNAIHEVDGYDRPPEMDPGSGKVEVGDGWQGHELSSSLMGEAHELATSYNKSVKSRRASDEIRPVS